MSRAPLLKVKYKKPHSMNTRSIGIGQIVIHRAAERERRFLQQDSIGRTFGTGDEKLEHALLAELF